MPRCHPEHTTISDYLEKYRSIPLLDVRTPAEFAKGHIPGAINLPIFDDDERIQIGTTYKQVSREEAVKLGFDFVGSKWRHFIETAAPLAVDNKVCVHCWRGGMRSEAMAWVLNFYGLDVLIIEGGYRSYRQWAETQFEKPLHLLVLGGMTGSHKTEILHEMQEMGVQVLDLENLANHQGSVFGSLGTLIQPTQEQFENNMAWKINELDHSKTIWVEDESITIGKVKLPKVFWRQLQSSLLLEIQVDEEERIRFLTGIYGNLNKQFLIESTQRISKRLGLERTNEAIRDIQENRMKSFVSNVLKYYDKAYRQCLIRRNQEKIVPVTVHFDDVSMVSRYLLDLKLM